MKDFYTTCLYDQPVTWKRLDKVSDLCYPGALQNHTLSCHLSNLILVGGQRNVLENNKDIYGYDLITNKWSICECIDQNGKNLKVNLDSHTSIVYRKYRLNKKTICLFLMDMTPSPLIIFLILLKSISANLVKIS